MSMAVVAASIYILKGEFMSANDMKTATLKKIDDRIRMYTEDRDNAFKNDKMVKYAALGMLIAELNILRCDIEEVPV